MEITTQMIKDLREATKAGVLDCRKALEASGGDYQKAVDFLREKGLATAAKRADRQASNGMVELYSHGNGRVGVMVEVNCETDFVARSEQFIKFAHEVALQVAAAAPKYIKEEDIPADVLEHETEIAKGRAREEGKPEAMLEKIAPLGTVLRRVYTEMLEGKTTFGRQIGTYPLLVGFSYPIELEKFVDGVVSGHGFRSLTAVEHPLKINKCSLSAIASLPSVGKKRAANILVHRPYRNREEFIAAMDDRVVGETLAGMLDFTI